MNECKYVFLNKGGSKRLEEMQENLRQDWLLWLVRVLESVIITNQWYADKRMLSVRRSWSIVSIVSFIYVMHLVLYLKTTSRQLELFTEKYQEELNFQTNKPAMWYKWFTRKYLNRPLREDNVSSTVNYSLEDSWSLFAFLNGLWTAEHVFICVDAPVLAWCFVK